MDNLQKSELVIAKILTLLMGRGVQGCNLQFDELELEDSFRPFFFPCVEWLNDEGVIRVRSVEQFGDGTGFIQNPVLTSYGMRILGLSFSLEDNNETLAEVVKNVESGSRSYSQAGDFFGGLLGGFTKSIGS